MSCDMFSLEKANDLLRGQEIHFFGDSNMRAMYKDLLWLLVDGRLISASSLKQRNEPSFANDTRVSNGALHTGRHYKEVRHYAENTNIWFHFLTRLYLPDFIDTIKNLQQAPHIIVMNSCVWDVTRWGVNGVSNFKNNLLQTFSFLKKTLPSTRIIWLTTVPPSFDCKSAVLTEELMFLRKMLPYHVMFANKYASDLATTCGIDVLDLHYTFQFLMDQHTKDGIHWHPQGMRLATNMLLTHIALVSNKTLPGIFKLNEEFLKRSTVSQFHNQPSSAFDYGNNSQFKPEVLEVVLNKWKKNTRDPKSSKYKTNWIRQTTSRVNKGYYSRKYRY